MQHLKIRVPATIANMGPGFDSFGMAVSLYNYFSFSPAEQDSLDFSPKNSVDVKALASDPGSRNLLFQAMDRLYASTGQSRPSFRVTVTADIPVARGLGSSSTAIIAGLLAANQFSGQPLETWDLLKIAVDLEGHPDNVAPALLGGVVLYDEKPYTLPWSVEWRILTLSPDYPVMTEEARRILPQNIALQDGIFNLRKSAILTYALLQEDPDALRAALADKLHQPYRRKLIREYDLLEQTVMDAGAYGMIISGSGSTMTVFYPTVLHASMLEKIEQLIREQGWKILINDVTVDTEGAVSEIN